MRGSIASRLIRLGVAAGPVAVERTFGRNRNSIARLAGGRAYFVKQPGRGSGSLASELRMARLVASDGAELRRWTVPVVHADSRFIVTELLDRSRTLDEHAHRTRRVGRDAGREIGRALAALHRIDPPARFPRAAVPWVLSLPFPRIEILREASAAQLDVLRIVQRSRPLCGVLAQLGKTWSPVRLIHGDIRPSNVLLRRERGRVRCTLVDWEASGRGDPAWDAGAAIGSLLSLWVLSIRHMPRLPLPSIARTAAVTLPAVRPAIAALARAWISGVDASPAPPRRTIEFAAARVVQSAWEESAESSRITGAVVCALQVAHNLAARPGTACRALLDEAP